MNQVKTINNNNNNNNIITIIIAIQINYKHMSDKQASKKELNSSGFKEKLIYMTSNSKVKAKKKKERERRQEDLRFTFSLGFRIHIEKTFLEVLRKYFPISKSLGCCYLQLN